MVIPFITLTAFRPLNEEHYMLKQEFIIYRKLLNLIMFILIILLMMKKLEF
ncbi:DUF3688 domain-containing protein [Spiroplasma citri]|nr:DUF3688 domain-containing protein [Spiroplasma citri]QIA72962.1 DUF3688 domain-containing protein [Spiroplasma citri]QIA75084.1 DUF3688 domain-containing protein [Spiroplasma citri]